MSFFRTLFGDPADKLEEKGDTLRLAGQWREAAWFYRKALEGCPAEGTRRERMAARLQEATQRTIRSLLEESASLARRRLRTEALEVLDDAERFAQTDEDHAVILARRRALAAPPAVEAGPATRGGESDFEPPEPEADDDADQAFLARLEGRPTVERQRLGTLGRAGRRGYVAVGRGDAAGALAEFEAEVAAKPADWVARELLGLALEGVGRLDDARTAYEAAYRRAPERHVLVLEVARILRERMGQPAAALERVEQAIPRHPAVPETLDLHLERVFLMSECGRETEAVGVLSELLNLHDLDSGLLLFNRGGLHERLGRLEEAEADLRGAVAESPSNVVFRERLGDLLFRSRRDAAAALESLDRALAIDAHDFAARRGGLGTSPDRARLQFKAARALFVLGRMTEARARVDEGIVVCNDPRVGEALLDLRRELWGGRSRADQPPTRS